MAANFLAQIVSSLRMPLGKMYTKSKSETEAGPGRRAAQTPGASTAILSPKKFKSNKSLKHNILKFQNICSKRQLKRFPLKLSLAAQ